MNAQLIYGVKILITTTSMLNMKSAFVSLRFANVAIAFDPPENNILMVNTYTKSKLLATNASANE